MQKREAERWAEGGERDGDSLKEGQANPENSDMWG